MKIRDGFILRQVNGSYIVVAVGKASESFRGMIKLNATSAFIWEKVSEGLEESQIADALTEKFDVDRDTAVAAVRDVLQKMQDNGILE